VEVQELNDAYPDNRSKKAALCLPGYTESHTDDSSHHPSERTRSRRVSRSNSGSERQWRSVFNIVRSVVITAVVMKCQNFSNVTPCSLGWAVPQECSSYTAWPRRSRQYETPKRRKNSRPM